MTADVVDLYPNIPHKAGFKSLKEALDRRRKKKMSTEDLVKMAEFVLKNNCLEFDRIVYQQVSGTAIGAKFTPPYACTFTWKQLFRNTNFKSITGALLYWWYPFYVDA